MAKALLLGNGINNVGAHAYTWKTLIASLINHAAAQSGVAQAGSIELAVGKPFPLLYEEIVAKACCTSTFTESDVKDFIAESSILLASNPVYEEVRSLRLAHVLTTNYEGLLVDSIGGDFASSQNQGLIKESRYSVFRHHKVRNTHVWFVHGDASRPGSILLGYEQYIGQTQRMRNYVVTGPDYEGFQGQPLAKRLTAPGPHQVLSWIDLFLANDLHILGFSFDFAEVDLWWLLTYRSRLIKTQTRYPASFRPSNTITYHTPSKYLMRAKAKHQLLEALGVKILSLPSEGLEYYMAALSEIRAA
jgi:hypothetical protein